MFLFDKTPEEKAAAAKQEHDEFLSRQREYLADRTGVDFKDIRETYKDDEEGLNATFNSLSGARDNRGWLIAGLCVFGVVATAYGVDTVLTRNPASIPYISTVLTALCAWGLNATSGKIHRIEQSVKDKAGKAAAPAPSNPQI